MNTNFTFIDLFSGIGGFHSSLTSHGGKCVGFSEIDKTAINTYCENHNEPPSNNLGNIKKIKELPYHDLLTAGVPCQSWSIAGKKLGFGDERGQLWNDTIYLLKHSQPKAFIFENVKGLADPRNKNELSYIMNKIKQAGYYAEYHVLNSRDYGIPQNRIRVYIIGFKEQKYFEKFKMTNPNIKHQTLADILNVSLPTSNEVTLNIKSQSLSSTNGVNDYFSFNDLRNGKTTIHSWDILNTTSRDNHICLLLLKNRRKKIYGKLDGNPLSLQDFKQLDKSITHNELTNLIKLDILKIKVNDTDTLKIKYDFKNSKISTGLFGVNRIFLPSSNVYPTLVASDTNDYITTTQLKVTEDYKEQFINNIYKPNNFRKITKEETCKIQGFPSDFILPETRTKWMKLLGNSVSVPVIDYIIEQIINTRVFI